MNITNCENNGSNGGVDFFGILTIVFIVLKLTGVINWSWWLVLLPLWIWAAVFVIMLLVVWLMSMR